MESCCLDSLDNFTPAKVGSEQTYCSYHNFMLHKLCKKNSLGTINFRCWKFLRKLFAVGKYFLDATIFYIDRKCQEHAWNIRMFRVEEQMNRTRWNQFFHTLLLGMSRFPCIHFLQLIRAGMRWKWIDMCRTLCISLRGSSAIL